MDRFVSHLSARIDATASDLKTSLHEHVDSTVDSRLDTFKRELSSIVRSGVIECIRTEGRYQHWRVETIYTPMSAHQQHFLNEVPLMANNSVSFIEGIPPPLLPEVSAAMSTSQCIADVTFSSGHSISIPLYNVPIQRQSEGISEQSTHHQLSPSVAPMLSSLLPNDNLDNTELDTPPQASNTEQINPEPFQTENASLLSTGAIVSDSHSSTNDVSSESPSNVTSPRRTVSLPDYIKQEYLDDGADNDDPSNASNVNLNIKTESMVCDLEVVKAEIKEEYEDDHDCGGCDRCIVKSEVLSDDEELVDNDGQVKRLPIDEANDESGVTRSGDNNEVEADRSVSIQQGLDNRELVCNPSLDIQNVSNENESNDDGGPSLGGQEQIPNTANQSNDQTVTPSPDLFSPSTSSGHGSNRTVSTQRNFTKRKQPPLNQAVKRSKKTLVEEEDGADEEEEEDIANEDRGEAKVLVLHLNCTQSNCNAKLDSMDHLHHHLRSVHHLSPYRCFATNCNARFDEPYTVSPVLQTGVITTLNYQTDVRCGALQGN